MGREVDLLVMKPFLAILLLLAPLFAADTRTPVLVELFTSEGCSSCPPADALLGKLNDLQPVAGVNVIALEEHVDYWDRQGWRDPFSSADFTTRQKQYAQWLHVEAPYTPQMVIDGRAELVGNDAQGVPKELKKAARDVKTPVQISMREKSGDQVKLAVQVDGTKSSGDVQLAITESKLATDVARGENAGRNLKHSAVVRQLMPIGKVKKGEPFSIETTVKLAREWKTENLSAVVFVQERTCGKVFGVAELPFSR